MASPPRRVVVTGWGAVCGLGQGVDAGWEALLAGRGAIRPATLSVEGRGQPAFTGPAARAPGLDASPLAARFGPRPFAGLDPVAAFALAATHEALAQAGLLDHPVLAERTTVIYGAGAGGNATLEEGYARLFLAGHANVHPTTMPRQMVSAAASRLSMAFGVKGQVFALSSACASSAHAVAEAMHMIRAGRCEVVVAGGAEAPITYGSWAAWTALKAMASDTCRPFSCDRRGMVMGEGAATLILEDAEHARARGAVALAEVAGAGASSDAHDITAPDGHGAVRALRHALADAGVEADTATLISAHGTGTPLNDRVESQALREVFGEALDGATLIATKSAHGHLFGAGGALEFLFGLKALAERIAPPTLNHLGADPECHVPLALAPTPIDHEVLVSNAFAFGGLNSVLVGRRA